jgi:tetratricopeptide (TPR) repeat protein
LSRATGDYCFVLDADEILQGHLLIPALFDAYHVQLNEENGNIKYWSCRVHRNDGKWKWEGVVHESLCHPDNPVHAHLECCRIAAPHDGARDLAGNKSEKLLAIYEAMKDPTPRDVFYHAQTLHATGRIEEAIQKFSERAKLGGWDEEVYYSAYQAGLLKLTLGNIEGAINTLLKAASLRPTRFEALVWACMILRKQGRLQEAYMLSCVAPKPSGDTIYVENNAMWRILEEHALASTELNCFPEAAAFFEYALQYEMADVHRERIRRNKEVVCTA